MDLKSFEQYLQNHDWYYPAADGEAFYQGQAEESFIRKQMQQMWLDDPLKAEEAYKLFQAYKADHRISI